MDLSILEREVGSMPIFGPNAVDGVPFLTSILSKAKPTEVVIPCGCTNSLYILERLIQPFRI